MEFRVKYYLGYMYHSYIIEAENEAETETEAEESAE